MAMASALGKTAFSGVAVQQKSAVRPRAARSAVVAAAVDRPIWYPGNLEVVPEYLDGSLPGDYGFDPLGLGSSPEQLAWNVQAELIHARLAMTAVAGILFTSAAHAAGSSTPEWYEAGRVYMQQHPEVSFGALVWTTFALSGWAELRRLQDIRVHGSVNDDPIFKGNSVPNKTPGYPGGIFDPFGLGAGDDAKLAEYKVKEIKNGRLAMVAFVGFAAQYAATGKGPVQNLADHLAAPGVANFVHNGVSVPFISN